MLPDAEARRRLMVLLDIQHAKATAAAAKATGESDSSDGQCCATDDFKLPVSRAHLSELVGTAAVERLLELFEAAGGRCPVFKLRRVCVHGRAIALHKDVPFATVNTLQLALNDDSEYIGQ
eukprot:SAG22_NODE_823_length_6993_cov_6.116913_7_plen_121_part_00